jgi:hypothetical protein
MVFPVGWFNADTRILAAWAKSVNMGPFPGNFLELGGVSW